MAATTEAEEFYLHDECWKSIFEFLMDDGNYWQRHCYLKSLSVVSKQFLTITNCLVFSLKVKGRIPHFPTLSSLLNRFSNLNSLDLTKYFQGGNLNMILWKLYNFPLKNLKSLHLSCDCGSFPAEGLRVFSKNITTLTSLTCSSIQCLNSTYLFLIADCFPFLEELNHACPRYFINNESLLDGLEALSSALFKLRKVNLTGHHYINNQSLLHLFKNWKLLEEANILGCDHITSAGIAFALRERPTLKSLSFTCLFEPEYCATLFAVSPQIKSRYFQQFMVKL